MGFWWVKFIFISPEGRPVLRNICRFSKNGLAGLYRSPFRHKLEADIMDIFWSIFSMPIGLLFCFGPVLVALWLAEHKGNEGE